MPEPVVQFVELPAQPPDDMLVARMGGFTYWVLQRGDNPTFSTCKSGEHVRIPILSIPLREGSPGRYMASGMHLASRALIEFRNLCIDPIAQIHVYYVPDNIQPVEGVVRVPFGLAIRTCHV